MQKKLILHMLLFCGILHASNQEKTIVLQTAPVIVKNYITQQASPHISQRQDQSQRQNQDQEQRQKSFLKALLQAADQAKESGMQGFMWIKKHPIKATAVTLVCWYLYCWYQLRTAKQKTQGSGCWSNWLSEFSLHKLMKQNPQELEQKLLAAINSKYQNKENPTDCVYALAMFSKALDAEITKTQQLLWWYKVLLWTKVGKLFAVTAKEYKKVEQQLTRLHFIGHIFTTWSTNKKCIELEK